MYCTFIYNIIAALVFENHSESVTPAECCGGALPLFFLLDRLRSVGGDRFTHFLRFDDTFHTRGRQIRRRCSAVFAWRRRRRRRRYIIYYRRTHYFFYCSYSNNYYSPYITARPWFSNTPIISYSRLLYF